MSLPLFDQNEFDVFTTKIPNEFVLYLPREVDLCSRRQFCSVPLRQLNVAHHIHYTFIQNQTNSQYSTVFRTKICVSCRKLRRFSICNQFCETLPFAKADTKDVETAAVKIIFLFPAFANGSVSKNDYILRIAVIFCS